MSQKRVCWNRQTGTFEGRVSKDVWVQVPLLAPNLYHFGRDFFMPIFNPHSSGCGDFLSPLIPPNLYIRKKRTLPLGRCVIYIVTA